MAWTTETYLDQAPAAGEPSRGSVALYELARAIHEREAAMGLVLRNFVLPDGTETSAISEEAMRGYPVAGPDEHVRENILRVRGGIEYLLAPYQPYLYTGPEENLFWWTLPPLFSEFGFTRVYASGWFMTEAGGSTPYTLSSLGDAIGEDLTDSAFSTLLAHNARIARASVFQRLQDALDLMLYPKVDMYPILLENSLRRAHLYDIEDPRYFDRTSAWAARNTHDFSTTEPVKSTGGSVSMQTSRSYFTNDPFGQPVYIYTSSIGTFSLLQYPTNELGGVLIGADIRAGSTVPTPGLGDVPIEITVSHVPTIPAIPGTARYWAVPLDNVSLSEPFEVRLDMVNGIPVVAQSGGDIYVNNQRAQVSDLVLSLDLTTILTDQA